MEIDASFSFAFSTACRTNVLFSTTMKGKKVLDGTLFATRTMAVRCARNFSSIRVMSFRGTDTRIYLFAPLMQSTSSSIFRLFRISFFFFFRSRSKNTSCSGFFVERCIIFSRSGNARTNFFFFQNVCFSKTETRLGERKVIYYHRRKSDLLKAHPKYFVFHNVFNQK